MFLLEPAPTPFDLNFRIFRIPVRVHPMFWILSAVLGWPRGPSEHLLRDVLLWVGCVFVSVLVHELGHVLMGLAFGTPRHIVLYSFGGLAIASRVEPYRWQRIAVLLAGPGAGFVLYGLVCLFEWQGLPLIDPQGGMDVLDEALDMLFWINLVWGLVNLLPVWPLDGGQISREVCTGISPAGGTRVALGISFLVAGLLAAQVLSVQLGRPLLPFRFLRIGGFYTALFFAVLALQSFQMMQETPSGPRRRREDDEDEVTWRQDSWR